MNDSIFSTCVHHMGPTIKLARGKNRDPLFSPAKFSQVLMTASGSFISASYNGSWSNWCGTNVVKKNRLLPGKYYLYVSPFWESGKNVDHPEDEGNELKMLMIDIITTTSVKIRNVDNEEGVGVLELAFKDVIKRQAEEDAKFSQWKPFGNSVDRFAYGSSPT